MPPPAVSVILPAYNAAATLGFAVQSVRRQSWRDWELIVVDDGSRDGTAELAQELARLEGRLRLIRQPNRGVSAARNAGIEAARGRYLAFLDADDLWLPRKLARQLEFMRRIGSPFSATAYRRQWGARLGPVFHVPRLITYETSLKSRPFISITVMADREQVRVRMPDIGRSSRIPEDLVAWLAILRTGVVAHGLDEDLARYRMVQGSRSANKLACAYQVWRVYRDFERLDVPSASWYFAHYAVRSVGTRVPWLWTT